ncbi:MAG: MarR family transcriptional regulator, partial [Puniceicoccales bacterium]
MPRQPVKPTIPPLEKTCPVLPDLNNGRSKMNTTADALTQVIKEFGSTRNQVFYTTRTIAQYFGISQNTANLAIQELEKQGLVRRVRSSHTLIL